VLQRRRRLAERIDRLIQDIHLRGPLGARPQRRTQAVQRSAASVRFVRQLEGLLEGVDRGVQVGDVPTGLVRRMQPLGLGQRRGHHHPPKERVAGKLTHRSASS
jgi:hypothetical protein